PVSAAVWSERRVMTLSAGRRIPWLLLIAVVGAPGKICGQEEITPPPTVADATITLTARTAAVGVGFVWGTGILEYRGEQYPVRVDGMGIGAVGVSAVSARGNVYHLTDAADLNGQYTALGAGAAIGEGGNRSRMRNAKGVVIEIVAEGSGVQLGIGPRGI